MAQPHHLGLWAGTGAPVHSMALRECVSNMLICGGTQGRQQLYLFWGRHMRSDRWQKIPSEVQHPLEWLLWAESWKSLLHFLIKRKVGLWSSSVWARPQEDSMLDPGGSGYYLDKSWISPRMDRDWTASVGNFFQGLTILRRKNIIQSEPLVSIYVHCLFSSHHVPLWRCWSVSYNLAVGAGVVWSTLSHLQPKQAHLPSITATLCWTWSSLSMCCLVLGDQTGYSALVVV